MKMRKKNLLLILCAALLVSCLTGCSGKSNTKLLDPKNPVTVTVWNYYNGDQLTAFEKLVEEFNAGVGVEKGIIVESVSQSSIDNLATALIDSVNGKVGADDVPSLGAVYAETAYILDQSGAIAALDSYFTAEELAEYVPSFIDACRLTEGGEMKLFPVSKSTEAFEVNATDWAPFAEATGITIESITSWEKLTDAAKAYYEWIDAQTPDVKEDGKALYGRDSVANYLFIGTKQLGHEMFKVAADGKVTVDLDRDTFKTLWDNYYIPFINGYFAVNGKYRSEDIKTGSILALTGSTSGVSYTPTYVTDANDVSHDIEIEICKPLNFENAVEEVAVQQGADYCVMKTNDAEQYAAVEFLKWFTDTERNLEFSISSGYSPVKLAANDAAKITEAFTVDSPKSQNMLEALVISADIYTTSETYTCRAFDGQKEIRNILGDALNQICTDDRAAVAEQLAAGVSHSEAVAPYCTDEYFGAWFDSLCAQINAVID